MTDKCRYLKKSKKVLKGYYICTRWRDYKAVKNCGKCMWYKPRFPKSLFNWIKELFIYDR